MSKPKKKTGSRTLREAFNAPLVPKSGSRTLREAFIAALLKKEVC
jgi:hypothetical protein